MTTRVEQIGDCTLALGDCLEILPTLGKFDLLLTDPPYGIGESSSKVSSRQRRPGGTSKAKADQRDYGEFEWDRERPTDATIRQILKKTRWAAIFGGNYFSLPPSSCWLVWDKLNGGNDFSDCELAWTNWPKAVRRIQWRWNGMIRQGNEERFHPTQKPLAVMKWVLELCPQPARTVIDPFAGSGTTGVACVELGRKFVGIEIDPVYFDIACRRIEQAVKKQECKLPGFSAKVKAVQVALPL